MVQVVGGGGVCGGSGLGGWGTGGAGGEGLGWVGGWVLGYVGLGWLVSLVWFCGFQSVCNVLGGA